MRYNDFIAEYLAAGLILTISLAIALADSSGHLLTPAITSSSPIAREALSLSSVLGAITFLSLVVMSYPIGYILFVFSLRFLKFGGRSEIFAVETAILKTRPYCDILAEVERTSGRGFAEGAEFEKDYSLCRMFLYVYHQEHFQALNSYWTRLSRMFAVFTLAFFLSSLLFFGAGLLSRLQGSPSQLGNWSYAIAFLWVSIAWLCLIAYRRALTSEIRNYVGVSMGLWTSNSKRRSPIFVFAYGSNMLSSRLTERVASARKLCVGHLNGYKLYFHKRGADGSAKADVVRTSQPDHSVHGVLFQVDEDEIGNLDLVETNYERVRLSEPVCTKNGPGVMAEIYQARPEAVEEALLPFDWYVELVVSGAKEHGLPDDYCKMLAATPSIPDTDTERQRVHRELLEE